jgi:hypothetical protein
MKAKVIETGEIVNVTPYPTWYKENGQGPDRREWDEDELEFIYSNDNVEPKLEETHQLKKIEQKSVWCPSKKQMESLKDMLKYNIGVFDYQKFMEVNSLYDDLKKIIKTQK